MNIEKYAKEIQELCKEQQVYLQKFDPRVIGVLEKLTQKALALNDDELIGYAYHSLAFAEYFIAGDYDAYLKHVDLAAKHLFSADNQSELIHVYNLIAIDALNKGMYDLSHHYFLKAHKIAEETGQETSAAILEENVGHILGMTGAYDEARRAFKRSLRGVKKDPSHPHYYNNVASCHMNEGLVCLELGKLEDAEKAQAATRAFMDKNPEAFQTDAIINYVMLDAQIAIRKGDKKRLNECVKRTVELLKEIRQWANYVGDLQKLVCKLLESGEKGLAGKLIRAFSKLELAEDASNAGRMLIETKIAYFKATGRTKELLECYLEQDRIRDVAMAGSRENSRILQDLIDFTNRLQKEQDMALRRKAELTVSAGTDPLTGIANRHAGDIHIGEAYDRAFREKSNFGVCILDADNLKEINDTRGHQVGDEMLISLASSLEKLTTDERIFAFRYGGDEFVLVFSGMDNSEIKGSLQEIYELTEAPFSAGICNALPIEKVKPWDYLQAADAELYKVKSRKHESASTEDISICSAVIGLGNQDL